jgi:hypothetical protein
MTLLREAYYTLYFFIFASFSLVAVKRTGDEVEVINVPSFGRYRTQSAVNLAAYTLNDLALIRNSGWTVETAFYYRAVAMELAAEAEASNG